MSSRDDESEFRCLASRNVATTVWASRAEQAGLLRTQAKRTAMSRDGGHQPEGGSQTG